ncbi:MAG: hypothetical protein AAF585_13460, partial [Verrucomicrobiota bacterium]
MRFIMWLILFGVVFGGGFFATNFLINQNIEDEVTDHLQNSHSLLVDCRKVHYNLLTKTTTVSGVDIKRPNESRGVRIEKATILRLDDVFPRAVHFTARGVEVYYLTQIPQIQDHLDALGINGESMNVELSYLYNPGKKRLEIRKFSYGSEEIGFLEFTGVFTNFDAQRYDLNEEFNPLGVLGFSIEKAVLKFEDAGIGARYTEQQARSSGLSVENWIKQQGEGFRKAFKAEEIEFNSNLAEDLTNFLSDPKSIQIHVAPGKVSSKAE